MSGPNKHKTYTSEDIRRYHSGKMTQAEMHAMEKAALEDPFLADAIEGYTFSQNPEAELAGIRAALDERTEKTKVIPISSRRSNYGWMRIAALVVVLAGAGWLILQMNNSKTNETALQ